MKLVQAVTCYQCRENIPAHVDVILLELKVDWDGELFKGHHDQYICADCRAAFLADPVNSLEEIHIEK